ncbi:MAG: hypothetical protein RI955_21 [Bacteroidota bacterium]
MNIIIRNILAVVVGLLVGGAVNMALVILGPHVIPPPNGVDITKMEGLKAAMTLMEPKHFLFPFLAHALGTLIGAIIAAAIAATHKMKFALSIGVCFLVGGVMNIVMLPSAPIWFCALDVMVAYIPMGYLGGRLMAKK